MKTLSVVVFGALVALSAFADSVTQINCRGFYINQAGARVDQKAYLTATYQLGSRGKVLSGEVSYYGPDITAGLYRGQTHGGKGVIFAEPSRHMTGLIGEGTDVRSDNPYGYRFSVPNMAIKSSVRGFQAVLRVYDQYASYAGDHEKFLAKLRAAGMIKDPLLADPIAETYEFSCRSVTTKR